MKQLFEIVTFFTCGFSSGFGKSGFPSLSYKKKKSLELNQAVLKWPCNTSTLGALTEQQEVLHGTGIWAAASTASTAATQDAT